MADSNTDIADKRNRRKLELRTCDRGFHPSRTSASLDSCKVAKRVEAQAVGNSYKALQF